MTTAPSEAHEALGLRIAGLPRIEAVGRTTVATARIRMPCGGTRGSGNRVDAPVRVPAYGDGHVWCECGRARCAARLLITPSLSIGSPAFTTKWGSLGALLASRTSRFPGGIPVVRAGRAPGRRPRPGTRCQFGCRPKVQDTDAAGSRVRPPASSAAIELAHSPGSHRHRRERAGRDCSG